MRGSITFLSATCRSVRSAWARDAGDVLNESDIYREWSPPPACGHAVACRWEQRVSSDRVQRVFPDGRADLLMDGSGLIEIVGLYDEVSLLLLPAGTHVQGIRFRPAAAAFRTPALALRNLPVPAESVLGRPCRC